jgi:EmrB/QacA subfamily drug resistance transporter
MNENTTGFRKWLPLIILSLALMIIVLDTTILNVSLRTIIADLGTTIQKIQWVITAYSLTLAALTITGGRFGDLFGRKRMFMLGAIIFAVGSFITSISHSVGMMITGEAIIEGIGAALMMPATSSLIMANYKGRDRQLAFGVWGGIAAGAAALGPVIGGWLTTNYSWRWAFRINVFVAVVLVLGAFLIKESYDTKEKPEIDLGGIIFSSLGLLLLVFGFIESSTYGWFYAKAPFMVGPFVVSLLGNVSIVIFSIVWGLFFLLLFILWEIRRERKGHTPLVSMALFSNSQFTVGATTMAIVSLGQAGLSFALPVFFQAVKNLDAFHTGLAMLPMSLALLIAAPASAYFAKHFAPKRIIQVGLIIEAIAFYIMILGVNVTSSVWAIAPGLALYGVGIGFLISQVSNITLSAVSVEQAGEASGVNGTLRTVGATLGSAILGAILLSTLSTNLVKGVEASSVIPDQLKPSLSQAVSQQTSSIEFGSGSATTNNSVSPAITKEIKTISEEATVQSSHITMYYGIVFVLIALLLSTKLPGSKNIESIETEKPVVVAH